MTHGAQQQQRKYWQLREFLNRKKENLAQGALFLCFLTFMCFKIKNDRQWVLYVMSRVSDDHFYTN